MFLMLRRLHHVPYCLRSRYGSTSSFRIIGKLSHIRNHKSYSSFPNRLAIGAIGAICMAVLAGVMMNLEVLPKLIKLSDGEVSISELLDMGMEYGKNGTKAIYGRTGYHDYVADWYLKLFSYKFCFYQFYIFTIPYTFCKTSDWDEGSYITSLFKNNIQT